MQSKITLSGILLSLTVVTLVTGCASTASQNTSKATSNHIQKNDLYAFPASVYEGYWAMVGEIDGEMPVISFRGNKSYNYSFKCHSDGSYTQTDLEVSELIPSKTGMQLKFPDGSIMTELKIQRLEPNRILLLDQMFIEPTLKKAVPNGIEFLYFHAPTLKPICVEAYE